MTATPSVGAGPDPRRWKALALLCLAMFVVHLDAQIVLLAVPSIERNLTFAPGAEQWVLSAYLLTFGGFLMLGGRMADLLGRRRMFFIGTVLFLVASVLCGMAWSGGVLIGARALQGASAAIMAPTALSLLMTTFEEGKERNKALGFWSGVAGFGATAALLVGGPVTDLFGWPWIFYLNIPVALAVLGFGPMLLKESHAQGVRRDFDIAGAVTITVALVLLVYGVVKAPEAGWLSAQTIGIFAASAVAFALFIVVERKAAAPLVPLRVFRIPTLVGGNMIGILLGMIGFGMGLLVSLYAQQVLGMSALTFGLGMAVMTLMTLVGSFAGQAFVTKVGFGPVAAVAMVLLGTGCFMLAQISPTGSYVGDILFALIVFGPGLGACYVSASIAALTGVPEGDAGLASGITSASFQIGGAIGVAIVSTVAISNTVGTDRVALTEGYRAAFIACVVFCAVGLAVALLLIRRSQSAPPAAGPAASADEAVPAAATAAAD